MGGRTVLGKPHNAWCEVPWEPCTCYLPNAEIHLKMKRKVAELSALIEELRMSTYAQQSPQVHSKGSEADPL